MKKKGFTFAFTLTRLHRCNWLCSRNQTVYQIILSVFFRLSLFLLNNGANALRSPIEARYASREISINKFLIKIITIRIRGDRRINKTNGKREKKTEKHTSIRPNGNDKKLQRIIFFKLIIIVEILLILVDGFCSFCLCVHLRLSLSLF